MKPDWDKLMTEFKDSKTALVADVDCTTDGKPLCDSNGVKGFPTIKYGDPSDLQDYKGGRDYAALSKFAKENLKPVCSPANIDLCDADKKKAIEDLQAMSEGDLEKKVKEGETKLSDVEKNFKESVEKLQKEYKQLSDDKDKALEEVKNSGLGLAKAVLSHKKKKKDEL